MTQRRLGRSSDAAVTRSARKGDLLKSVDELPDMERRVLLSAADVAAEYGVSRSFAYTLKEFIPWYRFGGVRFRRDDVESFLERERKVVPEGRGDIPVLQGQKTSRRRPSRRNAEARDEALKARYGF